MKIKNRVGILYIALICLPIILVAAVYVQQRKETTAHILDVLDGAAALQEQRVLSIMQMNRERLKGVSSRTQLRISTREYLKTGAESHRQKLKKILNDALLSIDDFKEIIITDTEGNVVARAEHAKTFEKLSTSSRDYLISEGSEREVVMLIGSSDEENEPFIYLAGPLVLDEETIGIALIVADTASIRAVTIDTSDAGLSGGVYILAERHDGSVNFLTSHNNKWKTVKDWDANNKAIMEVPTEDVMEGTEKTYISDPKNGGDSLLIATRFVEEGLGIIVVMNHGEALGFFDRLTLLLAASVVLTLLVGMMVVRFLVGSIINPVRYLEKRAHAIMKGDWTKPVSSLKTYDEFSDLAQVLEQARNALKSREESLHEEVSSKKKNLDHMRTNFVTVASHQLRGPLARARWALEMLDEQQEDLPKVQRRLMEDAYSAIVNMDHVVDALLTASKIEAKGIRLHGTPVNICDLLKGILDKDKVMVRQKKHECKVSCSGDITARVDESILRIIITNLVTNAIKYTPEHGDITLEAVEKGNEVLISVIDTGIGIPDVDRERIFEKMYRGQNAITMATEGTGLGLYIAYSLADILGGELTFESQEGEGTKFTLHLKRS